MKKQVVIVGITLLFICVGLSGCDQINIGKKNIEVVLGEPNSNGVIPVTLTGDKAYYRLLMSNPEKITVSQSIVTEDQMIDGAEPTSISIGGTFYTTGSPREYTLIILSSSELGGEETEVYRKTLTYYGANISIINCSAPVFKYFRDQKEYGLSNVYFKIENHGDLSADISYPDVKITIGSWSDTPVVYAVNDVVFTPGKQMESPDDNDYLFNSRYIPPGENKTFYIGYGGIWHIIGPAGEYQMTISINQVTFSTNVNVS